MAKSSSPLRLQADLMQAAQLSGAIMHRSAAEQIEYWADLGRKVSDYLDPQVLLDLQSGIARLKVERIESPPVDPDDVFNAVERDRQSSVVYKKVTASPIRYQVCEEQPGYLEKIDQQGVKTIGMFENGEFIAIKSTKD